MFGVEFVFFFIVLDPVVSKQMGTDHGRPCYNILSIVELTKASANHRCFFETDENLFCKFG